MLDRWGYVRTTLQQRGIAAALFRFRQLALPAGQTRADIPCYNEVLFLLNPAALPPGTRLYSDANAADILGGEADAMEEFSGLLSVVLPQPLDRPLALEFLQTLT
jgi:hypothetical protein